MCYFFIQLIVNRFAYTDNITQISIMYCVTMLWWFWLGNKNLANLVIHEKSSEISRRKLTFGLVVKTLISHIELMSSIPAYTPNFSFLLTKVVDSSTWIPDSHMKESDYIPSCLLQPRLVWIILDIQKMNQQLGFLSLLISTSQIINTRKFIFGSLWKMYVLQIAWDLNLYQNNSHCNAIFIDLFKTSYFVCQ